MTRQDYLIESARTYPDLGDSLKNCIHMILGINDEYAEYNQCMGDNTSSPDKIVKELGDIWWYTANLCRITGNEEVFLNEKPVATEWGAQIHAMTLGGLYKKELAYEGFIPDPEEVKGLLKCIVDGLTLTSDMYDLEYVFDRNIAKLRVRHPEGFNSDSAMNKDETYE